MKRVVVVLNENECCELAAAVEDRVDTIKEYLKQQQLDDNERREAAVGARAAKSMFKKVCAALDAAEEA